MSLKKGKEALVALGFTALEADIYAFLLPGPPSTGYRVAQGTGKPAANVYKALESMAAKGIVQVEESENKHYMAVPLDEVLGRLEKEHTAQRLEARAELEDLESAPGDERIYHLETSGQVFERVRSMLERAREVIMLDIHPAFLDDLRGELEAAVSRGVEVNLIAYDKVGIEGVDVSMDKRGIGVMDRWPVRFISLAVDGREQLQAYISLASEEVHEAIWSDNIFLAWLQHISIIAEFTLNRIEKTVLEGGSREEIEKHYRKYRGPKSLEVLGYRIIKSRFLERKNGPS